MNIVNCGTSYQIYDESVKTFDKLPVGCYEIEFNKMSGFCLKARPSLAVLEEKIYGDSEKKVDKILKSFDASDRNFGVILSGNKGVGKSLFARVLSNKAIAKGLPVILAMKNYPGIESFISSIDEEALVLFDEFEKNFPCEEADDDDNREIGADGGIQNNLLSLFDGVDSGKKLFVITCNDTYKLNKYFINRPGRFHYHFAIGNPTPEEIEEYMNDKLKDEYKKIIPSVISLSVVGSLTYDCLRAIAFEINQGYSLDETLDCLNLTRDRTNDITFEIVTEDGYKFIGADTVDLLCEYRRSVYLSDENRNEMRISYYPTDIKTENGAFMISPSCLSVGYCTVGKKGRRIDKADSYKPGIESVRIEKTEEKFLYKYIV